MLEQYNIEECWKARLKSDQESYYSLRLYWGEDIEALTMNQILQIRGAHLNSEILWFDIIEGFKIHFDYAISTQYIGDVVCDFLTRHLIAEDHILIAYLDDSDNQQGARRRMFNSWFQNFINAHPRFRWAIGEVVYTLIKDNVPTSFYLIYVYSQEYRNRQEVETFFNAIDLGRLVDR